MRGLKYLFPLWRVRERLQLGKDFRAARGSVAKRKFGNADGFRTLRRAHRLSLAGCGKLLGVTGRTVSLWESGRVRVPRIGCFVPSLGLDYLAKGGRASRWWAIASSVPRGTPSPEETCVALAHLPAGGGV